MGAYGSEGDACLLARVRVCIVGYFFFEAAASLMASCCDGLFYRRTTVYL
jgi:hypothetical protein